MSIAQRILASALVLLALGFSTISPSTSFASAHKAAQNFNLPNYLDLPPDASSEDYQHALNQIRLFNLAKPGESVKDNDGLDAVVASGEKILQWLNAINEKRDASAKLSFTDAQHRIGYPIDKANKYSPTIILAKHADFMAALKSDIFRAVVTGQAPVSSDLPADLTVETFLDLGRTLDRIYQSATRWRMMQPYLDEMAANSANDVRGYYFLSNLTDRDQKLAQFAALSTDEKAQIAAWLVLICRNGGNDTNTCRTELDGSTQKQNGNAMAYYTQYIDNAKALYDSFFHIPTYGQRSDITWVANSADETATIPFLDPATDALRAFMRNVEDEWHLGGWQLKLNFVTSGDVAHLMFQPGTTPHVNALGGNIITMDKNTPLTDWENNWTIRHEFGHVLGFPDCYVEFYDDAEKVMTNYQLDMTNLMCSRRGNLKETHKTEMTRVYRPTKSQ